MKFDIISVYNLCLLICDREEENDGFEQHVLLDHLIRDGFPKRGNDIR